MCNGVKEEHGVDGGRPPRETRANESTSRTEPGTRHPGAQSVYPAARQRGLRLAGFILEFRRRPVREHGGYHSEGSIDEVDVQTGGWSRKVRTQELKLELPGAARDWFNQLPKSIRRDWKELASAFRKKIDKTRTSYSERYYTWK
ncbi:hypothetical protein C6341_g24448 [Phytophthora cactorum]|nr:hypothetical protein C6341_g24448 [Phytophthora cactorum]